VSPSHTDFGDFTAFPGEAADQPAIVALRLAKSTGRTIGAAKWIARLEAETHRVLASEKRGSKPGVRADDNQDDLFRTVSP
jgi:hypothetical protein